MKRDYLEALGLDKETIDKIMSENGKDIEKAKGSLSDITAERDSLKSMLADRDNQLDELKQKSGDAEGLKAEIEKLQADNKSIRINSAVDKALMTARAKNIKAVKALFTDADKFELQEDGTIKGLEEQIKAIQKENDYLFEATKKETTKITGANPAESNDEKPKGVSKEEFDKMGYKERVDLKATNPELYDSFME